MMGDRQWPDFVTLVHADDIAPTPNLCPDCGETAFPGATVCDTCGTPLSVTETVKGGTG